jgi:exo-1,4-beta-D-glucosaminidase
MFDAPWWYRAPLPPVAAATVGAGGRAIVTFRGVNYRANIWCNGRLVANSTSTAGAYLYHDVDVTDALLAAVSATTPPGDQPGLAVEVYRSYDWGLDCKHDDTIPFNQQVSCRGKTQEQAQDLAITFVDWAPAPHDANMGLWRGVGLELAGGSGAAKRAAQADTSAAAAATATTVAATAAAAVTVRYPQVSTKLSFSGGQGQPTGQGQGQEHWQRTGDAGPPSARLEVAAELQFWGESRQGGVSGPSAVHGSVSGVFTAEIPGLFQCTSAQAVTLHAGVRQLVVLTADDCPGLSMKNVSDHVLWWPWQMGQPNQHTLTASFVPSAPASSNSTSGPAAAIAASVATVGLRDARVENDANDNAVFYVNGRRIFVRGGGWAPDLLQRMTVSRHAQELRLARDLGLNLIRLEGKLQVCTFSQRAALPLPMPHQRVMRFARHHHPLPVARAHAGRRSVRASLGSRPDDHAGPVLLRRLAELDEVEQPDLCHSDGLRGVPDTADARARVSGGSRSLRLDALHTALLQAPMAGALPCTGAAPNQPAAMYSLTEWRGVPAVLLQVVFMYSSDELPPPNVEAGYLKVLPK